MKKLLQQLAITLLFFTPIGYILKLISLQMGKTTPGVYVEMSGSHPVTVVVKKNPTWIDRFHWFGNGAILLVQGFYAVKGETISDFIGAYAFTALIFGFTNIIAAFFPSLDWNKKAGNILLLVIVVFSIFISAAYADIVKELQ